MKKLVTTTILGLAALLGSAAAQETQDHSTHDHGANAEAMAEPERIGDPWPLDTCIVTGEMLGGMGDPVVRLHEGREVRFCCAGCVGKFESDPATYLDAADAAIEERQRDAYPMDICIIDTSETLSADMAENHTAVIGNRLFVFCCPPCEKTVRAEPAKYIAQLDEAVVARDSQDYPLETCVVSGQKLGEMGEPVNLVVANRLIRLCCQGCVGKVEANPAHYLRVLDEGTEHESHGGHGKP